MSTHKPTRPVSRPTSVVTPPLRAARPQPPPVAASRPAPPRRPAAKPPTDELSGAFQREIPTSGIPLEEAMATGQIGSAMFGSPPVSDETELVSANEVDWFGEGEEGQPNVAVTIAEDGAETLDTEGEDNEDYGDDDPDRLDEDDLVETLPAAPVRPGRRPQGGGAAAPTSNLKLAFKRLQENGSEVYDPKLVTNLATVQEAVLFWVSTGKMPYDSMSTEQKYTRNRASEIIVTDRETKYLALRVLAQAILADDREGMSSPPTLTQDIAVDVPVQVPAKSAEPARSPMLDVCENKAVGCTSQRMHHYQSTGKCFKPDCPCNGGCQGFVGQPLGGQADASTKSVAGQTQTTATRSATGGGRPVAGSGQPSGAVRRPSAPASSAAPSAGSTVQGQRPAPPQTASGATRPVAPTAQAPNRPGQGHEPVSTPAAPGGHQQGQAVGKAGSGGRTLAGGTAQAAPFAPASPEVRTQPAPEQVVEKVEGQGAMPLITSDNLHWIMTTGGEGPDSSAYWPSAEEDDDTSEAANERRAKIIKRVTDFYHRAIHVPHPTKGQSFKPDLVLDSNSYRVVLAANNLAQAIEDYASAVNKDGYDQATEETLQKYVGTMAQQYVEAHKQLAPGAFDGPWAEYAEYIESFPDIPMGTLLHTLGQ